MLSAELVFLPFLLVQEPKVLLLLLLVVLRDRVYYSLFKKVPVLCFLVLGDRFVVQKLVEDHAVSDVRFIDCLVGLLEDAHGTLCAGSHASRVLGLQVC